MFSKIVYNFLFTLLILFSLNSCISQKLVHGNLPDAQLVSLLKVGIDSKKSTTEILGEPTFRGVLGDNSFYYVGTVNSKLAFLDPKLDTQFILELNFDKNNKLKKLYLYDENESKDVSMSSLETKHSGKKLTFLQQIFGNIGVGGMGRGTIIGSGKADN
jgi:outer membrane protein assembly factor BamE (lipoprotein component of BamABCDE complex)